MKPTAFFKCLSDETRLQMLLLIHQEQELCVCELTDALELSQPKISRHLASLRRDQLLVDRRQGKWVFYRINPQLPEWINTVIAQTQAGNEAFMQEAKGKLTLMGERPERVKAACC